VEPRDPDLDEKAPIIEARRRARRRTSSFFFFAAGIAFGTALYLLRARFATLAAPAHRVAFYGLVLFMVLLFWLGARAEADVSSLDERLRNLREAEAARRKRPRA